jgi:N-formylglutamate deformylase
MGLTDNLPFFLTIPHSGEQIPEEVDWLDNLSEETLMRDVDRYVDQLYDSVIKKQNIHAIKTPWHRYVIDLNRKTEEIDQTSVIGSTNLANSFPKGLHWSITTHNEILISQPMPWSLHQSLVKNYYEPFHQSVQNLSKKLLKQYKNIFHLDLHSMPSMGTNLHSDPGQARADIVVSDFHGKSTTAFFKDLVMKSYQEAGFQVVYNWPYVGGGITQIYGKPESGHNTI